MMKKGIQKLGHLGGSKYSRALYLVLILTLAFVLMSGAAYATDGTESDGTATADTTTSVTTDSDGAIGAFSMIKGISKDLYRQIRIIAPCIVVPIAGFALLRLAATTDERKQGALKAALWTMAGGLVVALLLEPIINTIVWIVNQYN